MAGEFATDDAQADDALADARHMGLPEEEIENLRATLGRETGRALWAMHLDALRALMAAGTQWRTRLSFTERGPVERTMGLDYAGLKVVLDGLAIVLDPESWTQLLVLERAAAAAMNGQTPAPELA